MWGGGGEPSIMDISPTQFPTLLRPLLLVLGHLEDLTITNILQTWLNVLPDPCGFYFMKKCRLTMGPCTTPLFKIPESISATDVHMWQQPMQEGILCLHI